MTTIEKTIVTIESTINEPIDRVWQLWTEPGHIVRWNHASDDWHTTRAENDLRTGGKFLSRMESRDGSEGFDFNGVYTRVELHKKIEYTLDDGRQVQVTFVSNGNKTQITQSFETEMIHSVELQRTGWQAIMDNFKNYAEASKTMERLHFEISINARAEYVYKKMLDEKLYTAWTAAFNPSSHFKGSWDKGAKILFLGEDEDGNQGGMVSRIKENIPNRFVSIEHLGYVQNGEEVTSGTEAKDWAGAMENYTFMESGGSTLLSVDMDVNQQFKSYFSEKWPKALILLKEICER
jgi:uncharacterized protein YndB with AHSA1/START domain